MLLARRYGEYGEIYVDGRIVNIKTLDDTDLKKIYDTYNALDNEMENIVDTICLHNEVDAEHDYVIDSLRRTVCDVLCWAEREIDKRKRTGA